MSYTHDANAKVPHEDIHALQEQVSESRREFFKQVGQGAVATAVATTAMHMGVAPYMKPVIDKGAAASANATGGWKNLFSLKPDYLYMNVGTTGSTPTAILDEYYQWYYDVAWKCDSYATTNEYIVDLATKGGIYGANPSEFIMSFTTTDGMMKWMQGQDWKAGDKLLITNMEHGGGLGPMYSVCNLHGVARPELEVKWVDRITGADSVQGATNAISVATQGQMVMYPTGIRSNNTEKLGYPRPHQLPNPNVQHPDDFVWRTVYLPQVNRAIKELGGVVAGMMTSSPPYLVGNRFPEKQFCSYMAKRRIRSTIDAAHVPGTNNVDLHEWGIDFFAGSGHKWQCGPGQTGTAYIRNGKAGDEKWSFKGGMYQTGATVSGTGKPYGSGDFAIPKYWPWNDSFRMSKFTGAGNTGGLRQFANGYRDPKQNAAQAIMSIGNNSIPLNRALYECNALWTKIGRGAIEDYVVTLAQYYRQQICSKGPGGLYAFSADFRRYSCPSNEASPTWDQVWKPSVDAGNVPVWLKSGLTSWMPMYFTGAGTSNVADYNIVMSADMRSKMAARASALLGYYNAQYGLFTRTTNTPHQLRFAEPAGSVGTDRIGSDIIYSALANANFGGVANHLIPLRFSTHLFHDTKDIDQSVRIFSGDGMAGVKDNALLEMYNLGEAS